MDNQNSPIQGHDERLNQDKPKHTWQQSYDKELDNGETMEVLEVHVSDDPESPIYYNGIPEGYKGGAIYRENLPHDFVGDPEEAEEKSEDEE